MNKIGLIIGREYFTRVKKRSFFLTTILVPLVIVGFYAVIIAIAMKGGDEKQKIAIIDEANLFDNKVDTTVSGSSSFAFIRNQTETSFVRKYNDLGYDGFIYIAPFNIIDTVGKFTYHSRSETSLSTKMSLERMVNSAIRNKRLTAMGMNPKQYEKVSADVDVDSIKDTKDGSKKSEAKITLIVSFACGILIYMMMIIYGTQVMRGVMEEKTNRIAEVVVSSVKPFQLMMGKILGIGAVGLTQFAIWIVLMFFLQLLLPLIFPGLMAHAADAASATNGAAGSAGGGYLEGLSSLPLAKIMFSFLFYFLGGYLTYASLFAAVGSVVSEDQQEAQQLIFPILMPIILGFVIMTKAVNEPNSSLAVFGSIFPLTSPVVMMGRITYDIPFWQLGLSMLLLVGTFIFFTWLTGKIYRIGILMYGKKPSWKEMMKWAFARS